MAVVAASLSSRPKQIRPTTATQQHPRIRLLRDHDVNGSSRDDVGGLRNGSSNNRNKCVVVDDDLDVI